MKKKAKSKAPRTLDKHLFEAGQQCQKRLWLDVHEPVVETPSTSRQEMSRIGDELRELARTAFPKGVIVEGKDAAAAAKRTAKLLADETSVLFDATFLANDVEARCDILVVHKDQEVDLFEIKSGTKVKHRYVNDLALQATVLEQSGLRLKRAYLLHVNSKYVHKEGEDFPPMQLLRSADVTAKVQKQMDNVSRRLQHFRLALANDAVLDLPMGTFCKSPFTCPHVARCRQEAPATPLYELPELTRQQEIELHKEGIEELTAVDPERPGLTFQQRRMLTSVKTGKRIVEPFVGEELRECNKPLHFVAMAVLIEPLPRFDQQRPWQMTPYGWAVHTLHEDGRVEVASYVHADRDDPRTAFVRRLAHHLEIGGTIMCWGDEPIREWRSLLDGLPNEKAMVRALLGHAHLDMKQLFEAAVFDPDLRDYSDLREVTSVVLGDRSGDDLEALDPEFRHQALQKARTPRVRTATREKIATDISAALSWQASQLRALYDMFEQVDAPQLDAGSAVEQVEVEAAAQSPEVAPVESKPVEAKPAEDEPVATKSVKPASKKRARPSKRLPKLPE